MTNSERTDAPKHTKPHRDTHLSVYLAWPILSGIGLAGILGLSVGGLTAILGSSFADGVRAAGVTFFATLGVATLGVFVYAAYNWGPKSIERLRQTVEYIEPIAPEPIVDRRFISLPIHKRQKLIAPGTPSAGIDERSLVARVRAALAPPSPVVVDGELTHQVEALAVDAPFWVKEFYHTTVTAYGLHTLSRNAFKTAFGDGGRRLHEKYVSGPQNSDAKGLWDAWGILGDGARRSKVFAYDLETILKMDADVWAYAQAKNALSPGVWTSGKQLPGGSLVQTRQVRQDRKEV